MPLGIWGGTLWGEGPAGAGGNGLVLDVKNCVVDVIYRLGFQNFADCGPNSYVTPAELYQFADDAAKRIAYQVGALITLDTSVTVLANTAAYSLPATHVFTLMAFLALAGNAVQLLRLTPVRDLWALDANWPTTAGNATRASMDAGSVGTVTLYPDPIAGGTLKQVCQEYTPALSPTASTLPLASVFQDYFSYRMLEGARGKESDAAMREMAAHFAERARLYEQIAEHLWGPGQ